MASSCTAACDGAYLLSPEELSSVLSSIELVSAMWSGTDELHISPGDEQTVRSVAEFLQLPVEQLGSIESQRVKDSIGNEVVLRLRIGDTQQLPVWVNVRFGLRGRPKKGEGMWTSAKDAPPWLARENVEQVNAILYSVAVQAEAEGEGEEEQDSVGRILNAIEQVSEYLSNLPHTDANTPSEAPIRAPRPPVTTSAADQHRNNDAIYVRRTWYYLPSLSSKPKRGDICELALHTTPLPLSGFLLAGKPGLIVLEYPYTPSTSPNSEQLLAGARAMDAFWSTIKTTSWSDLPGAHKKISERLTEPVAPQAFTGFHDITDWPEVERSAQRGRKSDLSKLIRWLDSKPGINGKWVIERCLGVGSWES